MNRALAAAIGVALIGAGAGAVSTNPAPDPNAEVMNPMIAGAAMLPSRDIFDNIATSPEHTKLAQVLGETGVAQILKGKGPFTLFAPTNAAFHMAGASPSKPALAKVLNYHIVRGRLDSKTLLTLIGEAGGRAKLNTLSGGTLMAVMNGPTNIALIDERGNVADIAVYDVYQANGVVHVIDKVMNVSAYGGQHLASDVTASR